MPILALTTEPKCKLCRHPERPAIDELIGRRSAREKGVNLQYVLERMRELGVVNPTEENIKTHLKKHCEVVSEQQEQELAQVAASLEEEARALGARFDLEGAANADSLPDRVIALYDLHMRSELRQGRVPKVTPDQVRAFIDTKTRRRHNERLTDLLDLHAHALTGAIGWVDQPAIEATAEEVEEL